LVDSETCEVALRWVMKVHAEVVFEFETRSLELSTPPGVAVTLPPMVRAA